MMPCDEQEVVWQGAVRLSLIRFLNADSLKAELLPQSCYNSLPFDVLLCDALLLTRPLSLAHVRCSIGGVIVVEQVAVGLLALFTLTIAAAGICCNSSAQTHKTGQVG